MGLQQKGWRERKSYQVCAGETSLRFLLANTLLDECAWQEPFSSADVVHYFKRIHCQVIQRSTSHGYIKVMFHPPSWVLFTEFCEVSFPQGFRRTFIKHHAGLRCAPQTSSQLCFSDENETIPASRNSPGASVLTASSALDHRFSQTILISP